MGLLLVPEGIAIVPGRSKTLGRLGLNLMALYALLLLRSMVPLISFRRRRPWNRYSILLPVCLMNIDLRAAVLLLCMLCLLMIPLPIMCFLPTVPFSCYARLLLLETSVLFVPNPGSALA